MKNKISIFILLITLTIPQVASAAWWNPLSWFEVNKEEFTEKINNDSQTEPSMDLQGTSINNEIPKVETKVVEKEVIKEVPVEKIVEKVVTKSDQSIIDENNKLKLTIKDLELKISKYITEIEALKNKIQELEKPLSWSEIRKKEIEVEISKVVAGIALLETKGGQYSIATGASERNIERLNYHYIKFCRTGTPPLKVNGDVSISSSYPNQYCLSKDYTYNELINLKAELGVELANLE